MKIALVTDGTWGDVLPFIFLARGLKKHGDTPVLFTNKFYGDYIKSLDLDFVQITDEKLRASYLSNRDLWHLGKGVKVIGSAAQEIFEKSFDKLNHSLPSFDQIISYTFIYAAYTVAELHNIPCVSIAISPVQVRSNVTLPVIFPRLNLNFLPIPLKKLFYLIGDNFFIDPHFKKRINEKRVRLGLKSIKRFVHWNSLNYHTIGLWPDWYYPVQIDQKRLHLTNFPTNIEFESQPDEELITWMKNGSKPILVTMGSGYYFNDYLINELNSITRNELRFVYIAPNKERNVSETSKIAIVQKTSLSQILPHVSIFINHGGAGSVAQAVSAGIPQIIIPLSHDQPDNATNVKRCNLGEIIWSKRPKGKEILEKIRMVKNNEKILNSCKQSKNRVIHGRDAIEGAVHIIKSLYTQKPK